MSEPSHFLLVDDNQDDAFLLRRAFAKAKILNPLHVVHSADEAMDYLGGHGKYADRSRYPIPAVVLLDLKMPGADGLDVLRWLREQPVAEAVRVVVMTSSENPKDLAAASQLGAHSYLVKPTHFERFVEISQALAGEWLWLTKPPKPGEVMPRAFGRLVEG